MFYAEGQSADRWDGIAFLIWNLSMGRAAQKGIDFIHRGAIIHATCGRLLKWVTRLPHVDQILQTVFTARQDIFYLAASISTV
jgi:hypothetical protein